MEVWRALVAEERLALFFAGLINGGALGSVGLRLWGIELADRKLAP